MTTITNGYGKELNWEPAFSLMDDDICNELSETLAPCSEQQFFDAYCVAHEKKFGEEFELAKVNPNW